MIEIDPVLALREALFEVEQRLEDIARGRASQPALNASVGLALARHANDAVATLLSDLASAQSQISVQAADIARARNALTQVEALMSTAEPYRDAADHSRALDIIRTVLGQTKQGGQNE